MPVYRIDRASLTSKPVRLDNGMLRAPALLTRAGVFEYRQSDGRTVREYRPESEVFSADSLASFALVPLTDDHPRENDGEVTAQNAKRLQVGSVGMPTREGNFVAAQLLVTDAEAIAKIDAGKRELSCGYYCDREVAPPGAKFEGQPYDLIQRNIRGNHVALVVRGRAGPEARVKLDANTAVQVDSTEDQVEPTFSKPPEVRKAEPQTMKKITIDGVSYEVSEQVAEAFAKHTGTASEFANALKTDAAKMKTDADKATARADAAESALKTAQAELAAARDPKALSAAVAERVALEATATRFGVKCDGLDNGAIKVAVIAKIDPEIKTDGKSADYVQASFDALVKRSGTGNVTADAIANALKVSPDDAAKFKADAESREKKIHAVVYADNATAK